MDKSGRTRIESKIVKIDYFSRNTPKYPCSVISSTIRMDDQLLRGALYSSHVHVTEDFIKHNSENLNCEL